MTSNDYYHVGDYPNHYQYYWQQPVYQYYEPNRIGWTCPGCGSGYSPTVLRCWNCGQNKYVQPTVTWSATNTNTSSVETDAREVDGS
jgi:uncharacterized OB-fold protein